MIALALYFSLVLTSASFVDQNSAEAHFARGLRYTQSGEHAKAYASFLEALKLRPDSIPIL